MRERCTSSCCGFRRPSARNYVIGTFGPFACFCFLFGAASIPFSEHLMLPVGVADAPAVSSTTPPTK